MAFISFQPHDHFDVPTWDGSDSTTTVNGMAFKPDSLLIKKYTANGHTFWNNSTLGVAKNWKVSVNSSGTDTSTYVASYTSDGFTLTGNVADTNDAGQKYSAACWKANGATTSSNTTGSINATVQADTTSGFSIVKWTGTGANGTLGHGLGVTPKLIIGKNMSVSNTGAILNMSTVYVSDPEQDFHQFAYNPSQNVRNTNDRWNDTAPTTSVFTVGSTSQLNGSNGECVAYVWAEVKGFSKFGFYSGTGNIAGTKVYCGFKPKWVMVKYNEGTEDWTTKMSGLTGYGLGGKRTRSVKHGTTGTSTNAFIEFESNGFRIATTDGKFNNENGKYFYMAFAEMPMVASNGQIALAT